MFSDKDACYKNDKLRHIQALWNTVFGDKGDCIVDFIRSQDDLQLHFNTRYQSCITIPTKQLVGEDGFQFNFSNRNHQKTTFSIYPFRNRISLANGETTKVSCAAIHGEEEIREFIREVIGPDLPTKIRYLVGFSSAINARFERREHLKYYETLHSVLLIIGTHRGTGAFNKIPKDVLKVICTLALTFPRE